MNAIEADSLAKSFGSTEAISGVSFEVGEGEVFGFLGPNGAGKSTTMMILTTLLRPTSGRASICGIDVSADPAGVRKNIGYVPQDPTADEYLTGRENLQLQARLNHIPASEAVGRIDEVLELVELAERQHDAVVAYSGGMRKRLDIAGGLLHRPRVLFLDEPTVGLDIQTRSRIWEYIRRMHRESNMAVFLTTHYMEEADRLCDRIGIIDGGSIKAAGSPSEMKAAMGGDAVSVTLADGAQAAGLAGRLRSLEGVSGVEADGATVSLLAPDGAGIMPGVLRAAEAAGAQVAAMSLDPPTLDDVFMSHTGRGLRDGTGGYDRRREHARARRMRR